VGAAVATTAFWRCRCQRYEDGYFTAYQQIATERFDFVFHYGDYIYDIASSAPANVHCPFVRAMPGEPDESYTLDDYRQRYALYKNDPDLQAAHAAAPFIMSYDDHEVDNNWAGDISEENTPPELFLLRRAAAFQAWYEHMPVPPGAATRAGLVSSRIGASPSGISLSLNVLDTRLFRSDQPCGDGVKANCHEALEPHRTMLGDTQERWLLRRLQEHPGALDGARPAR